MNTPENPTSFVGRGRMEWIRHRLIDETQLQTADRRAGHDYVPMDVYVDAAEQRAHFSASAVLVRLSMRPSVAGRRRS